MDPVSASIPLTDISKKKKKPADLEAQVSELRAIFSGGFLRFRPKVPDSFFDISCEILV